MTEYHASLKDLPMPHRIKRLRVDHRGFPVPMFVAWPNGEADHRVINADRFVPSVKAKRCWICGDILGRYYVSIIGCMCAVNRVISEPPSHYDCAEFAVKACPFLARPQAHRREAGIPEQVQAQPGFPILRNPGVACLWASKEYPKPFRTWAGQSGMLFSLGEPVQATWYRQGRLATRLEVIEAIEEGLPNLENIAREEGHGALEALAKQVSEVWQYLPYGDEQPSGLKESADMSVVQ